MTEFGAYLQLGFSHITDLNGYDHILFIIALCAIYQLKDWKKGLILVTAFTLGHSITLALATLRILTFRSDIIEFLIPVTILITAVGNFFHKSKMTWQEEASPQYFRYVLALCFGLIHGLGFSNYLQSLLGQEQNILQPLFAFNVGLELGQLLIVLIILIIASIFNVFLRVGRHDWNLAVSGMVAGVALSLVINTNIF